MTMNWSDVDQLRNEITEPPSGSFSAADYAVRYGCGSSKARDDLAKMNAAGKLKKTMVKVKNYWIPYYTAVKSPVEAPSATPRRSRSNR